MRPHFVFWRTGCWVVAGGSRFSFSVVLNVYQWSDFEWFRNGNRHARQVTLSLGPLTVDAFSNARVSQVDE